MTFSQNALLLVLASSALFGAPALAIDLTNNPAELTGSFRGWKTGHRNQACTVRISGYQMNSYGDDVLVSQTVNISQLNVSYRPRYNDGIPYMTFRAAGTDLAFVKMETFSYTDIDRNSGKDRKDYGPSRLKTSLQMRVTPLTFAYHHGQTYGTLLNWVFPFVSSESETVQVSVNPQNQKEFRLLVATRSSFHRATNLSNAQFDCTFERN